MSPTKQMKDSDIFTYQTHPKFEEKAKVIRDDLRTYDYEALKKVMKCNDKLLAQVRDYLKQMDFTNNLQPALFTYDGIAFKYLSPDTLDDNALAYLQNHLFILSGMYGTLRCFDGVNKYRLEMGAPYHIENQTLYQFHEEVNGLFDDELIINLASKEYSKLIKKPMVTIEFKCLVDGKYKTKGTLAKMARGRMLRFLAENQVQELETIKKFNDLNFEYNAQLSDEKSLVFVCDEKK